MVEGDKQIVGANWEPSADPNCQLQLHVRPVRGDLNHTSALGPTKEQWI